MAHSTKPGDRLTDRQHEVLRAIAQYIDDRGYPPNRREIAELIGARSTNGIQDHLIALERKGVVERDPMASRALRITVLGRTTLATGPHRPSMLAVGVALILSVLAAHLTGCEALEPEWSQTYGVSEVNPHPGASCDDICDLDGSVCLEQSCAGGPFDAVTLATDYDGDGLADGYSEAACDEPIRDALAAEPKGPWSAYVSCCCAAGY